MDIHLHGKKTTAFLVLNVLLVVLVFFVGWMSGVMTTGSSRDGTIASSQQSAPAASSHGMKISDITSAQQTAARLKSGSGQLKRQPIQTATLQARKEQPHATLGRTDTIEEASSAAPPEQPEPTPSQKTEAQPSPQPAPEAPPQEKTKNDAAAPKTASKEVGTHPATETESSAGPHPDTIYLLQVGSYLVKNNAFNTLEALEDKGYAPFIHRLSDARDRTWYVLYAGSYPKANQARQAAQAYKKQEESVAVLKSVPAPVFERRQKQGEAITRPEAADDPAPDAEADGPTEQNRPDSASNE